MNSSLRKRSLRFLALASMLFLVHCGPRQEDAPDGSAGGSDSSESISGKSLIDGGSHQAGDAGETATVSCPEYGLMSPIMALGGRPSAPTMILVYGTPGPTCATPNPIYSECCSFSHEQLSLSPEQQTVGVQQSDCTRSFVSFYWECKGSGGGSGPCAKSDSTIEVTSIDDTQITVKRYLFNYQTDAGSWGPAFTYPRCP